MEVSLLFIEAMLFTVPLSFCELLGEGTSAASLRSSNSRRFGCRKMRQGLGGGIELAWC